MNDKQEMIKQVKLLVVILIIVVAIAVFIGIKNSAKPEEDKTNINKIDMSKVVIDGITKDNLEAVKGMMEKEDYDNYKEAFRKIENGEVEYKEGMSLKEQKSNILAEDKNKAESDLEKALNSTNWHYYVTEDGTLTDTIVFDDENLDTGIY